MITENDGRTVIMTDAESKLVDRDYFIRNLRLDK